MKAYRLLLGFLALALLAAVVAWGVGADPGYVLIQRAPWTIETTLVFALGAVLLAWIVLSLLLWLLRWPLRAMLDRARRRGRIRYSRGALALTEGRWVRAEKLLLGSSKMRSVKLPALVGAYHAARLRGDVRRQGEILARLGAEPEGALAAATLRAEAELADGRAGTAIELLTPLDHAQRLPPAAARVLARALALRGRGREALPLLVKVRSGLAALREELDAFEGDVLARALLASTDAINLRSLWQELSRTQRRLPGVAAALARRATALGLGDLGDEVQSVLRKAWDDDLVLAWAGLPATDRAARLRSAEGWLREHPDSGGLLLALGRLCREDQLWAKSEEYLQRALQTSHAAAAWEELGRTYGGRGDHERASRAYSNALLAARGEATAALTGIAVRGDVSAPPAVLEERNEHGVPRLPEPSPR